MSTPNAELTQLLRSDPTAYQHLVQQAAAERQKNPFGFGNGTNSALAQYLAAQGVQNPQDYHIGPDGQIYDDSWWDKHGMTVGKIAAGTLGGIAGGSILSGILSGGGAPAGATLNAAPEIPTVGFEGLGPTVAPTAAHTAGTALTAGGVLGKAKDIGKKILGSTNSGGWAEAGKVLGGFTEGEANNRLARGRLTQNYDKLMLDAAENRRADTSDALKKLYQTGYLQQGGRPYSASAAAPYTFGFGPKASTAAQQQGASTLQGELLKRLQPGGSYTPQPLDSYANRGLMETIGNYGSLITGGIGAAKDIFGNDPTGARANAGIWERYPTPNYPGYTPPYR